jgi:hypothetical protein
MVCIAYSLYKHATLNLQLSGFVTKIYPVGWWLHSVKRRTIISLRGVRGLNNIFIRVWCIREPSLRCAVVITRRIICCYQGVTYLQ